MKKLGTTSRDYQKLIQTAEDLIRQAKAGSARKLLAQVPPKKVPREHALPLANLARRAGQARKALEILWPIVKPHRALRIQPTAEELGEYAVALLSVGSYQEASSILNEVAPTCLPLTLYKGFAEMTQWNYASAVPEFEKYLTVKDLPPYKVALAQLNLAACLTALGETEPARSLVDEIIQASRSNGWLLLHKNGLELGAQLAFLERNWKKAKALLNNTREDWPLNKNDIFVRKWNALVDLYETGGSKQSLDALTKVKASALEARHWETVRDCDYHQALVTKNSTLLLDVYFGTPFPAYRKKIRDAAKSWIDFPNSYVWKFEAGRSPIRTLDLHGGHELTGSVQLKPGKSIHRTLMILASDFYRPVPLGSLHNRLFPEERFNPLSGSLRVHKAISRLREWLAKNDVPIDVVAEKGAFHLSYSGNYGLLITDSGSRLDSDRLDFQILIERLHKKWPHSQFSSSEAADLLDTSDRLAREILRWGVKQGLLIRSEAGRATRYTIRSR